MILASALSRAPTSNGDWIFIGICAAVAGAGLIAAARWLKKAITDVVTAEIATVVKHAVAIDKQVTPNGGHSNTMADQVVSLNDRLTEHLADDDRRFHESGVIHATLLEQVVAVRESVDRRQRPPAVPPSKDPVKRVAKARKA